MYEQSNGYPPPHDPESLPIPNAYSIDIPPDHCPLAQKYISYDVLVSSVGAIAQIAMDLAHPAGPTSKDLGGGGGASQWRDSMWVKMERRMLLTIEGVLERYIESNGIAPPQTQEQPNPTD